MDMLIYLPSPSLFFPPLSQQEIIAHTIIYYIKNLRSSKYIGIPEYKLLSFVPASQLMSQNAQSTDDNNSLEETPEKNEENAEIKPWVTFISISIFV